MIFVGISYDSTIVFFHDGSSYSLCPTRRYEAPAALTLAREREEREEGRESEHGMVVVVVVIVVVAQRGR